MEPPQLSLWPTARRAPDGLVYRPGLVSEREERALLAWLGRLRFGQFRMRGVTARREVVHFGAAYAEGRHELTRSEDAIPDELLPLRDRCAALAGEPPDRLVAALAARYPPGAGVGWHRDAPQFGSVVGVSLGSPCRMRIRPVSPAGAEALDLLLEPRSAYVLAGAARWRWQHAIPPVKTLRYSLTFRTVGSAPR